MIVSHGKFVLKKDQLDKAYQLFEDMVKNTLKEPGCMNYDYFISMSAPHIVMLFQEWDSIEAIQNHFLTEHMNDFLQELPEILESEVITHRYAIRDHVDIDNFHESENQGEIDFEFGEEPVTLH